MATTGKFMTLKSVKGIAATLSSDLDVTQLSKLVMDSLQQSPQMKMQEFSPRARFLTNISSEEVQRMLNDFLERLSKYYCILLVQERSRTNCDKYAAFQIHWLQSIKAIVTYGENLALNSGQIENDEMTKDELVLAEDVAGIILQSFDTQCDEKDILIMFQTIARVVFLYQQSSAVSLKEGEISEGVMHEEQIESDSDDTLLRVAGAQLHRMINVRKEHLKRKDRTDESMATIRDELEFLKVISMDATQKGSLPVSLRSTELGGRIFPLMELIPFVKQIVDSVKREVNDDTFKRYGERLFQVDYMYINFYCISNITSPSLLCR